MQTEGVVSFASMGSFANVGVIIANMKAFVGGRMHFAKARAGRSIVGSMYVRLSPSRNDLEEMLLIAPFCLPCIQTKKCLDWLDDKQLLAAVLGEAVKLAR